MQRYRRGREEAHADMARTILNSQNMDTSTILGYDDLESTFGCPLLNVSICPVTENSPLSLLVVYNPLSRELSSLPLRIPVKASRNVRVFDEDDNAIPVELIPVRQEVLDYPGRGQDVQAEMEACFNVDGIPALGEIFHAQCVRVL